MKQQLAEGCCYTGDKREISLEEPGVSCALPDYIMGEFRDLFPSLRRRQVFFGGHPVSITRHSCEEIFELPPHRVSPYLVCEKSDGVRYLLVVARVDRADAVRGLPEEGPDQRVAECYFVSRRGNTALDVSVVDVDVSLDIDVPEGSRGRRVVEILDGELVKEHSGGRTYFKYLIFDVLVHLGTSVVGMPLRSRLQQAQKFLHCNQMLGRPGAKVAVELKDFFRLTNHKFNVVEFLFKRYIGCLEHQNDGLIFNHEEKEYVLGTTNPGYIKWKPPHLNTVDFMLVPNQHLEEQFGPRLADLYAAVHDSELGYTRQFCAFVLISEEDFHDYNREIAAREQEKAKREMEGAERDQFGAAFIVECCYDNLAVSTGRTLFGQLMRESIEDIRSYIMKPGDEGRDLQAIRQAKEKIYDKHWKVLKPRLDKRLPNNIEVIKRIEQSIRDNITKEELINKCRALNEKAFRGF